MVVEHWCSKKRQRGASKNIKGKKIQRREGKEFWRRINYTNTLNKYNIKAIGETKIRIYDLYVKFGVKKEKRYFIFI